MEITFGKHKGESIYGLPDSYLRWLATSGSDKYIAEFAGNILKRWGKPKASDHITFDAPVEQLENNWVYIEAPFSLLEVVKSFPYRKWDTYQKRWYVPADDVDACKAIIDEYDAPKARPAEQQTLF